MDYIFDNWHLAPIFDSNYDLAKQIAANRQQDRDQQQVKTDLSVQFHDPFLFSAMKQAVDIIAAVVAKHGLIMIHGDYDADGLTSTAILAHYFQHFGLEVIKYIPDRLEDGYGLAHNGVEYAINSQVDLVITVDCGITSHQEVQALKDAGIMVIVTDHHQCLSTLPPADACINPQWPAENYPFKFLAGAGVALKLAQALCIFFKQGDLWQELSDLAMIGTVADVMPLQGENVALVRLGLEKGKINRRPVLNSLIDPDKWQEFSAKMVSFNVTPKINAAGRMGNIAPAMEILLTNDLTVANYLAAKLQDLNEQRRELEQNVLQAAIKMVENNPIFYQAPVLFIAGDNWHLGVLGIVAARLASRYRRPTIVLTVDGNREGEIVYHGSGRTYGGADILAILRQFAPALLKFGGHSQAVGLSLTASSLLAIQEFCQRPRRTDLHTGLDTAKLQLDFVQPQELACDLVLPLSACTLENYKSLQDLQPFGANNPEPIFMFVNVQVIQVRVMGKNGQHLQLLLNAENGKRYKAVLFNGGFWQKIINAPCRLDILASLQLNTWQGMTEVQLRIIDLHINDRENEVLNFKAVDYLPAMTVNDISRQRQFFTDLYNFFQVLFAEETKIVDSEWLRICLSVSTKIHFSAFLLQNVLTLWQESAILSINIWQTTQRDFYLLHSCQPKQRMKLSELTSYKKLFKEGDGDDK